MGLCPIVPATRSFQVAASTITKFYVPDLTVNIDNPFVRDGNDKLRPQPYRPRPAACQPIAPDLESEVTSEACVFSLGRIRLRIHLILQQISKGTHEGKYVRNKIINFIRPDIFLLPMSDGIAALQHKDIYKGSITFEVV